MRIVLHFKKGFGYLGQHAMDARPFRGHYSWWLWWRLAEILWGIVCEYLYFDLLSWPKFSLTCCFSSLSNSYDRGCKDVVLIVDLGAEHFLTNHLMPVKLLSFMHFITVSLTNIFHFLFYKSLFWKQMKARQFNVNGSIC